MASIAAELAALRKRGTVKSHASNLAATGGALSTPDAEKEAIEALKKQDLEKKAQAAELLKKGGSAYSQQEEHAMSQTGKKKAEWEKKNETKLSMATDVSQTNSQQEEHAMSQTGKKKAEWEKKNEAKMSLATGVSQTKTGKKTLTEESEPAPVKNQASVNDPVETVDDGIPDLEEVDDATTDLETAANVTQQTNPPEGAGAEEERQITNRNEKKARKMMTRLGMRPVSNIARVTLKAGGGRGYFFIDRPDVFISAGGKVDTYVIFGEAKQGGAANAAQAQAQAAMAQQQAAMAAANATAGGKGMPSVAEDEGEDVPELTNEEGGDNAVNEDGVDSKDIDLVMSQASCSRSKAVSALKESDGDLVNAIMSLTT